MSFKICARRLFLTYSQCPDRWTKEFVKRDLIGRILCSKNGDEAGRTKIKTYVIGEERHEDGGKHYHCYLEGFKKIQVSSVRELDIEGIHGNYQAVENVWSCINYCKKGGNWVEGGVPGLENKERNVLEANSELEAKMQLMSKMRPREQLELRREYQKQQKIKIKETNIREIEIEGFQFQRDLEPYLKQLANRGIAGFNIESRPMGIIVYGEPKSGKSTWLYKLGEILGESHRSFNEFRTMASSYKGETIVMLDEFEGKEFKKYAKQIKMMITDPDCHTLGFNETKQLVWPRRVLICTNEDVEQWEWVEGLKERFMIIRVYKDGRYQMKIWENNKLVDKRLGEMMSYLGFEIKEVREIDVLDLDRAY